jgi:uncharacterized membrane protein YoaT (DUF817 family)
MNFAKKFLIFIKKQASSALFGGIMLAALLLTKYVSIPGIYRYDLLFIIAIVTQIILIVTKLETWKEVLAIIIFHICAMVMELYKTSTLVGSWAYPEKAYFAIATVPLFTGFMYSSVGSYIARAWRINKFRFINLPSKILLVLMAISIYVNFFTNHFTTDVRYLLFIILIIMFWKTKFYVELTNKEYKIDPLFSVGLMALFLWLAEQIGTLAQAWVYPNQAQGWKPVSFQMFTSWYMLIVFSFVIITLLYKKNESYNKVAKQL